MHAAARVLTGEHGLGQVPATLAVSQEADRLKLLLREGPRPPLPQVALD